MSDELIYLDNNATTAVAPECAAALARAMEHYGNPSSKHRAGEAAKQLTLTARAQVAGLLGATPPEIVFTSGGTESNHQAILAALALMPGKRHIVTSQVEHPSTLSLLNHLEGQGARVTYLPVDGQGRLDLAEFEQAIDAETALVSLMWANNETGVLFPIAEAARIAASKGVLFHTDAVQAVGKVAIDLKQVPVDFLSFSGHKIHAPKGVGTLFVRKSRKIPPTVLFGHQERGRRGGTENVPGIAALGVAAELAKETLLDQEIRVAALRDRLETELVARMPGTMINGARAPRVGGTTSLCLGRFEAEPVLDKLDRIGICASAGAACTAAGTEPSHVLIAMGLEPDAALGTLRLSLSRYTTAAEIDRVVATLPDIAQRFMAQAA